jgi:hypothetical protein
VTRTRTNNRVWLLLLLIWPLAGALALVGCARREPEIHADRQTGCEYLRGYWGQISPRIAPDGKTHMGCKGVRP